MKLISKIIKPKNKLEGIEKSEAETAIESMFSLDGVCAEKYGDIILWELPIQYCAQEACKEGDTILDIGGNIGGVAIAFSRIVGKQGTVYTFEPNFENHKNILLNKELNNANNLSLVPLAVFSETGKLMTFYSDKSFYKASSSLIRPIADANKFQVVTISIDDFVSANNITPDLVKIDVEGAELEVLKSMEKTIEEYRMPIIFEYSPNQAYDKENDCINFLEKKGYIFFDTNSYDRVSVESYYGVKNLVNVFCIYADSNLGKKYQDIKKTPIWERQFIKPQKQVIVKLTEGIYVIDTEIQCDDKVTADLSVKIDSTTAAYYQATGEHLKSVACRIIPIYLKSDNVISINFSNLSQELVNEGFKRITIYKIEK